MDIGSSTSNVPDPISCHTPCKANFFLLSALLTKGKSVKLFKEKFYAFFFQICIIPFIKLINIFFNVFIGRL